MPSIYLTSVIYIDPFVNFTAVKQGDKYITPRPGTDSALEEAIAYVWLTEDTYDHEYVQEHVHRFDEWAQRILGNGPDKTPKTPKWAEEITGVRAPIIKALARRWAFRWFEEGTECKMVRDDCMKEGKLGTRTGKFEFVSELLEEKEPDSKVCGPMAFYKPSREGHCSPLYEKYKLQLICPHPRYGFHTQYDQHNKWLWEIPEHRQVVEGNPYAIIRIHPKRAAERGIHERDIVRVWNDRAEILCMAHITNRLEEHTVHLYGFSGMFEPTIPGEKSLDKGGCSNLLTSPNMIDGRRIPGMTPNSTLVEMEVYKEPLVPGMVLNTLLEHAYGGAKK